MRSLKPRVTLWRCGVCDEWWQAVATRFRGQWRMYRMPAEDESPYYDECAPFVRVAGAEPDFCPTCGSDMARQPVPQPRQGDPLISRS